MVVYGHLGYAGWVPLVAGCASIGVVLFFFLSGFLMGHHYLPAATTGLSPAKATPYWGAFLLRRFLRVYPPYLFAPVVGYLLLMPKMPPDFEQKISFESLSVLGELARFGTFREQLGIYWTIEIELFFYLLYPLIISLFLLCRNQAAMLFLAIGALVFFNHFPHGLHGVSWRVPLPLFWVGYISVFVAGIFAAILAQKMPAVLHTWRPGPNARTAIAFIALSLTVVLISRSSPTHGSIWTLEWWFIALFFLMFLSLLQSNGLIGNILSSRFCTAIGRASYSLYLTHIIAIHIVIDRVSPEYQGILAAVIVLSVLTFIYYMFMEKPFVILSKRIRVK